MNQLKIDITTERGRLYEVEINNKGGFIYYQGEEIWHCPLGLADPDSMKHAIRAYDDMLSNRKDIPFSAEKEDSLEVEK